MSFLNKIFRWSVDFAVTLRRQLVPDSSFSVHSTCPAYFTTITLLSCHCTNKNQSRLFAPEDKRISFTLAWSVGAASSWLTHHWHSLWGSPYLLGLFPRGDERRLHGIWGILMKGDTDLNTVRTTSRVKTFTVRRRMWRINRNRFVCGSGLEDTLWVHLRD